MFDLLLFAYVVRCLLEFRIDERESWLMRAAFVFGVGMTNNWAMIGFFPLFLVALVWIKGLSFFNLRFLARMSLCLLAGLSLYLLLPLVQSLSDDAHAAVLAGAEGEPEHSAEHPAPALRDSRRSSGCCIADIRRTFWRRSAASRPARGGIPLQGQGGLCGRPGASSHSFIGMLMGVAGIVAWIWSSWVLPPTLSPITGSDQCGEDCGDRRVILFLRPRPAT